MCGIVGIAFAEKRFLSSIDSMVACLEHRGPDGQGVWLEHNAGVAFGHRRLAINDLSLEGQQPMQSHNQRYVMVLNGEIYNFQALKKTLIAQGVCFRGNSDTEVLLEAISSWGIEHALKQSIGMFAFALWDKADAVLYLARDRFGEKPLYYGWVKNAFIFGSELKALKKFEPWAPEIDRNALASYLRYSYVPAPYSIYKDIYKLKAGVYLTVKNAKLTEKTYWSATDTAIKGLAEPFTHSFLEITNELEQQLQETIKIQMIADVPLGAFLSGGIDSSVIVALMQAQSMHRIKTFSLGFNEQGYDEAPFAAAIAKHLGTEHHALYVSAADALKVIPVLPTIYDEPFADSSQIPTYLLSRLTKQQVTVSLSGDGGDELFGGYKRYFLADPFWRKISKFPLPLRKWVGGIMEQHLSGKAQRLGELLKHAESPALLNQMMMSAVNFPNEWIHNGNEYQIDHVPQALRGNFIDMMMALDATAYLSDDILVKVDRAGMAASLESRIPFLDHRVYEFAWKIPREYKIKSGQGKLVLREILNRYLPKTLYDRPKMGFGIPLGTWLRGPLRAWAEALLDPVKLKAQWYLNEKKIHVMWQAHLAGKHNHQAALWNILMFCGWLEKNNGSSSPLA